MLSRRAFAPSSLGPASARKVCCAAGPSGGPCKPAHPPGLGKSELMSRLLGAKEASGKTFTQIGQEVGLTNIYTAQLFYNQQQLQPNTAAALQKAVPALTQTDVDEMMRAPVRSFDPHRLQEPTMCRLYEAIIHSGDAVKSCINEEFGDGIMSAIDFYFTLDKMKGTEGEARVVLTFNGKFLPYKEQRVADNVATLKQ